MPVQRDHTFTAGMYPVDQLYVGSDQHQVQDRIHHVPMLGDHDGIVGMQRIMPDKERHKNGKGSAS